MQTCRVHTAPGVKYDKRCVMLTLLQSTETMDLIKFKEGLCHTMFEALIDMIKCNKLTENNLIKFNLIYLIPLIYLYNLVFSEIFLSFCAA